jgi:hypothetical protein
MSCDLTSGTYAGLQRRRFAQVFEYLDSVHSGVLDLLAVRTSSEFTSLSAEIWQDVEGAALVLCAERGLCSGPITAAMLQDESERRKRLMHAHTVLAERCMVGDESADLMMVDLQGFSDLMAEVLYRNRLPTRTYVLPDIRVQPEDAELTFQPVINDKSVEIAQQRWQERTRPVHEDLHEHAKIIQVRYVHLAFLRHSHIGHGPNISCRTAKR